jgi:hypothetical protein
MTTDQQREFDALAVEVANARRAALHAWKGYKWVANKLRSGTHGQTPADLREAERDWQGARCMLAEVRKRMYRLHAELGLKHSAAWVPKSTRSGV